MMEKCVKILQKKQIQQAKARHTPGFPLFPVGLDDTVQVFLNYKSLHGMAARHDRTLVVSRGGSSFKSNNNKM